MDLSTPRLFLPLLFGVLFPVTLIADQSWVLRTEWKCESDTQDPTLEYFKTKEQLLKEIESTRRKYSTDGILKSAPCKPSKFTYWYDNGNSTTKPPKDAVTVEANPSPSSTSSTTPKPGTAEKNKSTGKGKWVMWLEKLEEGKWSEVTRRRYEYLESEGMTEGKFKEKLKTYENAVESENKKVIQKETELQSKGQTVKPIRYRVKWVQTESTKVDKKSNGKEFVGDYQSGSRGSYDGFQELSLRTDGSLTFKAKGQGDSYREWNGKWVTTSEGWVKFTDGRYVSGEDWDKGMFSPWIAWKLESSSLTPVYLEPKDQKDKGKPVTGWRILERK